MLRTSVPRSSSVYVERWKAWEGRGLELCSEQAGCMREARAPAWPRQRRGAAFCEWIVGTVFSRRRASRAVAPPLSPLRKFPQNPPPHGLRHRKGSDHTPNGQRGKIKFSVHSHSLSFAVIQIRLLSYSITLLAYLTLNVFFASLSRMSQDDLKSLPTLLRREDAARALGVSLPTLKRLLRSGELAGTKVGGQVRIRFDELKDFIDRQTRRGAAA